MFKLAVAALIRILLAACLALAMSPATVFAQSAEGFVGWSSPHTTDKFGSADAACRSQWQYYNGNPNSRYIGTYPWVGNPNNVSCSWTQFQFLCVDETGGGISACGTVFPTYVTLNCASGYTPTQGKFCMKDPIPERPTVCNTCSSVSPIKGNPVVLATGAKVLQATDYETADGDFKISRSYRSFQFGRSASFQTAPVGLAGGWMFDFAPELQLATFSGSPSSPTAKLALLMPDGSAYDFAMQSGGAWVPDTTTGAYYSPKDLKVEFVGTLPSNLADVLTATSQWKVTDADDTVWEFDTYTRPNSSAPVAVGRPSSRTTRNGYRWDYAYRTDNSLESVTDSFGREATFTWSQFYVSSLSSPPSGGAPFAEAVSTVALPDGTSLRYTYDPPPATSAPSTSTIQRLVEVERANASSAVIDSTTYSYGDSRFPQHITAITDFNDDVIASYSYDARGRGIVSTLASGANAYAFDNSESSTERVSTVTGPLGKEEEYHFEFFGSDPQDVRLTSIEGQASTNTPSSTSTLTYDSNNFIETSTDDEGRVTTYTRDSRGRPTSIEEATGTAQARTTDITWHSTYNVPTRVEKTGLQVDYAYYSNGQLQTRTETDTTTHTVPYVTAGETRTWTYTWTTGGRLASINGPRPVDSASKDDTLTFAYDSDGNLQTSTNGLSQVTTFASYDANGRPGTMTDANGIVTEFTYDTLGRTETVKVKHPSNSSLDALTTFDYDIHDRVTGITSPATDKLIIDYDIAGRVIAVRAASGERIDYQLDADGGVTRETVKRADTTVSRSISRTFDELGRLLSETLGPGRTSRWGYDKVDNLTEVTSGRGLATQAAFDPLNRLVSTVAPDTGTTATDFNDLDLPTSHTDAISVQTTFVRNGFGDVIREVSPDRGTSTYHYNEAGELTSSIDGRGQQVDYSLDILGRVTQKVPASRPSSETITYTWDSAGISGSYGVGRLSSFTDDTGTTSFSYDHRGNLLIKRQTIGSGSADLAYTYDLADRITQIAYPSGRLVAYDRDSKGRVSQVKTKASSGVSTWTTLASSMTYEPWGSLTSATLGNGLTMTQAWSGGRLISKRLYTTSTSANLSLLTYKYDGADNIGSIRDGVDDTKSTYYGYDANDRLAMTSLDTPSPPPAETYAYTSGKNRLASVVNSSGTRSISYDARGNTSSETRPSSVTVSATYDGYGRLLTYARTGDPSQTNAYNGVDQRVSVTSGSTTHEMLYDQDGRLMGEYGASASDVIAETIWLGPASENSNDSFGGFDGTGGYAPLAIVTGSSTSTTLYWVHGNHLGVPLVTTDASGATASPPAYTMPGFPGQMRTLSDIYYNRYRDYDSSVGRYMQGDPIGLAGGENAYTYALNNPLYFTDPSGLTPVCNYSGRPVLVAGTVGYGHGHPNPGKDIWVPYMLPDGKCIGKKHPVYLRYKGKPCPPLVDVDVIDLNGDGKVRYPGGIWDPEYYLGSGESYPGSDVDAGPLWRGYHIELYPGRGKSIKARHVKNAP